jgi:hypothetical protein
LSLHLEKDSEIRGDSRGFVGISRVTGEDRGKILEIARLVSREITRLVREEFRQVRAYGGGAWRDH